MQAAPAAERRLVSVLFADLVGFTDASEGRDAEDTRELLSRYFETARTVIERYGGTVENPAMALAQLLAQLRDKNGRIAIPGFYRDVLPLSAYERKEMNRLPMSEAQKSAD